MALLLQPLYKETITGYTIERSLGGGFMARKPQYPSARNQQPPLVVRKDNAPGMSANIKISYKFVELVDFIPDFGPIEANIDIVDMYDTSFDVRCENARADQNNVHYIMAFANVDTPDAGFVTDIDLMSKFRDNANVATNHTDIVNINTYFDGNIDVSNPINPGSYYTIITVARNNREEQFHDPIHSIIVDVKAAHDPVILSVSVNFNT